MLTKRTIALALIAAFAIVGGIAIAVGVGSGGAANGDSIAFSPTLGHRTTAPNGPPGQVIAAIVSRAGAGHLLKAGLGAKPNLPGAQNGIYLHFVLAAESTNEESIRSEWEADVVQGAVADALAEHGQQPVVGSSMDLLLPNGATAPNVTGGMGDVTVGQSFSSANDHDIKTALANALSARGLTLRSISILHADQPAPAVVVTADDPAAAVAASQQTVSEVFGQAPPTYEGFYFEIDDASGAPIAIDSAAYRSGAGRSWVAPAYSTVAPQNHG